MSNGMLAKVKFVEELAFSKRTSEISSGFVGAIVCWTVGIGLAASAVAFAVEGGLKVKLIGVAGLIVAGMICGWARTAPAKWKLRLAAALISISFALLISEIALRCVTHFPVSTVSNLVPDTELGYVLDPKLTDVDDNGFRNPEVLVQADIVAIGDSHTQGFNAEPEQSWPQQLAATLNQSVYNMGVGGYGPLQYEILISRALQMRPKRIVVGLSLGNDLGDVARGIHQRDTEQEIDNAFRYGIRYHTATGSAIDQLIRHSKLGRPAGFEVHHPVNPTYVANQRVSAVSHDVDLTEPQIAAAFDRTMEILSAAHQRCARQSVGLIVMLIPTRESVYAHCQQSANDSLPDGLQQLAQRETDLRSRLQKALTERQINCVDILPTLSAAVDSQAGVYSTYDDGQPLAEGYRIYASALASGGVIPATLLTN